MLLACQLAAAGAYEDMLEAIKQDQVPAIAALLKRGFDVDTTDKEGNSLLMLAAKEGRVNAVKLLLKSRAKVNARNEFGETALMLAAIQGHLDIARELLQHGAQVNRAGWTPLMYAATKGNVEIARLLIAYGAQINAAADNGITALMMAAREGRTPRWSHCCWPTARMPNLTSASGATAISLARERKFQDVVNLLAKAAR